MNNPLISASRKELSPHHERHGNPSWRAGDSKFDMEAGKRAGCQMVACTFGFGTRKELARYKSDLMISRLATLLRII